MSTWLNRVETLGQLPGKSEGRSNSADLAERFENALHGIARGWRHAVNRRFKYMGIGLASWMTIAAASQGRSSLSQSELANMIAVSGASMVHTIDRLVKAGLVIREPSVSDRRVNRIVITDAGRRLYAELRHEAAAVSQQLLAGIEAEKLARLTELLEQLQFMLLEDRLQTSTGCQLLEGSRL